jgi:hypothetical protein
MVSRTPVRSQVDPRLSQVASVLGRLGTLVYCWSESDWQMQVDAWARRLQLEPLGPWRAYTAQMRAPSYPGPGGPRVINLHPTVCAQLAKITRPYVSVRGREADAFAWSVQTLAHEAKHVAGFSSEVQAECYGMQSMRAAAKLLGRTPAEGRFLAEHYWRRWYRWLDPAYRSAECRNGGRLDLDRTSDLWP